MKKLALSAGFLLLALAIHGAPATLTNKDVLALIKAGLPTSTIVAQIETSRTNFDTAVGQLVNLSKAGVNARVLEAMIRANSGARLRTGRQERLDWREVQCHDETSVRRYLDAYPHGQYEQSAQNCLAAIAAEHIAERLDWREVQCDTEASVRSFLDARPGGRYEQQAKDCLTAIAARRQTETKQPGEVFRDCPQCPELVVLPAGTFKMGSPASEAERYINEGPRYWVTIAKPLVVGKYEVTFAEWDACWRAGNCSHSPRDQGWGRDNHPVINVSWRDVQQYLAWLSRKTDKPYRLLSESEWEYAARAGTTTPFHFGDTISTDQANYNGNHTYGSGRKGIYRERTVAVGSFPANNFGLHDMHGNVREWVEDCWSGSYSAAPSDGSAWTRSGRAWTRSGDCERRTLRGGSWEDVPKRLRSAVHFWNPVEDRSREVGFRVARALIP